MRARQLGALLLLGASCADAPLQRSQVVVFVGGDSTISELDVRVFDLESGAASSTRTIDLSRSSQGRLPTSFTVIPASDDGAARFRIVVQGLARGGTGTLERARAELLVPFTPGATTLLPVVLSAACAEQGCGCEAGRPCAESCLPETGQCAPVAAYRALPEIEPGTEVERLESGLGVCPPGALPAADGSCFDLDECAFYVDECDVTPRACVNLPPDAGRYTCKCPKGYLGMGFSDSHCHLPCEGDECF